MSKRIRTIPKFASEAAERAFWEKSDSSGYLDWKKTPLMCSQNWSRLPRRSRCGSRSIFSIRSRLLLKLEMCLINR